MPDSSRFENGSHLISYRVYYEDTDAGGVVYHANFLKFAERARTEALRAMEIGQQSLKEKSGLLFVVRHLAIDYLAPGRLDDLITVETTLHEIGKASMAMRQRILRDEKMLADLKTSIVTVGHDFRPIAIPSELKKLILSRMTLQHNA